ncbi:hypothetical protein F511_30381 [Dorcoceras hygrometricum]|uniref:Uncharacterized protein n=1 Tax=Dorcoceras hygrometricum TaxID=472368 RepID=A0A2Z7CA31_9LAMI|nr:hypothetical protein F511_30381 [Dorcoceras hygrometricum]
MSLFDLQDVCIVIGSIETLDLPMVVDLIGTYGLKGPYCTLTTTDWFLQALSVIPRGSWGDVARRFTMIRWAVKGKENLESVAKDILYKTLDKNMFSKIKMFTMAKDIWEKLTQLCEGNEWTGESNRKWADSDSDESTSTSSTSESEKEEIHCLMADNSDEVFDFSNIEFAQENLVSAMNKMVHEYKKLSQTFEDVKAENKNLIDRYDKPDDTQLGK